MNAADRDWLKWHAEGGAGKFTDRAQRVLAELDRRGAAIERVRKLCQETTDDDELVQRYAAVLRAVDGEGDPA
jgi:hypothetical protein